MNFSELKKKKIGFISLGCDKNRVDLEKIIYNFRKNHFKIVNNPNDANIIIINTCAFINASRQESINTILEMAEYKKNICEKIIVTGCLSQLNLKELTNSLPEVDLFVKIDNNINIINLIADLYHCNRAKNINPNEQKRLLTTNKHYAYLKIAEGCDKFCSYCSIPYIRGRYKSVKMEQLICEAKYLVKDGVKELILVAQDVTNYGTDLYNKKMLVPLLKELSLIKNLKYIRLLYCYPEEIDDELIEEIKINPKIIKYIDIPLQHINNEILKNMNRKSNKQGIISLIKKLRNEIPDIIIRSTFILGFPGETDEQFEELCKFIKQYKLNNVGFFKYSKEPGTLAYKMKNQIPEKTKENRLQIISNLQYKNVISYNKDLINKEVNIIIDNEDDNFYIARLIENAPLVDGIVLINKTKKLKLGQYGKARIIEILDYDLRGEIL